jgi:UDP-N-acetylglucosamine 2-epimerase (non-hydrolysing)
MENKVVVTITGIRPDFIRMSEIFKRLDQCCKHILVHTGQHYDKMLSDIFFEELNIRKPDYILNTGKSSTTHYTQLSYLSVAIFDLFKDHNINPDLIILLGDANTSAIALPLRKEGYRICHIEAGMRSYDKRMLEEINRTVADHCSHILFVYHEDYKKQLEKENITEHVYVVGNTITEVCRPYIPTEPKRNEGILLDIHRPENFKYKDRMEKILKYANVCSERYGLPVKMLKFHGTVRAIENWNLDLGSIELVDLMSFKTYLRTIYHCKFIISDSGTAQEEPALLRTPVIVPRDFTERPQSISADCSYLLHVDDEWEPSFEWLDREHRFELEWLGDGHTAERIINILKEIV